MRIRKEKPLTRDEPNDVIMAAQDRPVMGAVNSLVDSMPRRIEKLRNHDQSWLQH
jgi:hypothetical protein